MTESLFPEIEAEEKRRERRILAGTLPRFDSPSCDNEALLNLQYRYIVLGDRTAWAELWERSLGIAGKLITKERKEKGFYLSSSDYEDKRIEAVEYVLRRYAKRYRGGRQWHVSSSFISALYGGVRHALYYDSQRKKESGNAGLRIDYVGDFFDVALAGGQDR